MDFPASQEDSQDSQDFLSLDNQDFLFLDSQDFQFQDSQDLVVTHPLVVVSQARLVATLAPLAVTLVWEHPDTEQDTEHPADTQHPAWERLVDTPLVVVILGRMVASAWGLHADRLSKETSSLSNVAGFKGIFP